MDLRQLRYFVVLAEQRHFGKAAELLNMAQPPLSQQIKAMEDELQVTLFDRSMRPIELTPAGRTLLREARQILQHMTRAQALTKRAAKGQEGRLVIGATGTAAVEFLPPVLEAFCERSPGVLLSLREMSSPAQFLALEKSEIHLGFVRPPVLDDNLASRLVHQEPFLVALPASHPLAAKTGIGLAELSGSALVVFDREEAPGFRDLIMHVCQSGGFFPERIQEASQMSTMLALVAARAGVALVPRSARRIAPEGVAFRPITDDCPLLELYAVWPRNRGSALIDELLAVIQEGQMSRAVARQRDLAEQDEIHITE